MGRPSVPEKAILFNAILYRDEEVMAKVMPVLIREFGESLYEAGPFEWNYSDYYRDEMGDGLKRIFIFHKKEFDPSFLSVTKLKTNGIEDDFRLDSKRRVNIDPGYITLSKVVLATTKNYSHRIYLGNGIYGEVTLYFMDGTYRPHLFTYRDYAGKDTIDIFLRVRGMMKDLI